MSRYIPHTQSDVERMLKQVGVPTVQALFESLIPKPLGLGRPLDLPPAMDEQGLLEHLGELASKNRTIGPTSFLGAGIYPHGIPTAVDMLLSRAEFYTSYTPYQPEISQGTLQAIFEFQTLTSEILGLPLANASMYDGSTAAAEAVLMARRLMGDRKRTLGCAGLHPEYRQVVSTYLHGLDAELEMLPLSIDRGQMDMAALERALDSRVACVLVQTPNCFGVIEDVRAIADACHRQGALCITVSTEPLAFGLLAAPGELGADIAVAEGIGLATPPSLGGPGLGLFATRDEPEYRRALPGRLVGETVDRKGRRGYVLTLATREQHIRRERATSNICTNTGLVALAFTIHMSLLGRRGFRELARLVYSNAGYAMGVIFELPGLEKRFGGPCLSEFALRVPGKASAWVERLLGKNLLAGFDCARWDEALADTLLISVSESHRKADIDRLAKALGEVSRT